LKKENGKYRKGLYCCDFSNCSDGDIVFDLFLLKDTNYCSNDRGVKWLSLTLEDRTGTMHAKVWSDSLKMEYEGYRGQIVLLKGKVSYYAGRPDLSVEMMQVIQKEEIVLDELFRCLEPDKVVRYKENMKKMISILSDEALKKYISAILDDELLDRMARLPVKVNGHHSYRGGMLEHTCEVSMGVYYLLKSTAGLHSTKIDLNLAVVGAMLHDIGNLIVLEEDGYSFKVNRLHKLNGDAYDLHVYLQEARKQNWLDEKTFSLLLHVIDSSHENGEPKTLEAMIVRSVNQLSLEMSIYEEDFRMKDLLYGMDTESVYSKNLKREIYRIRR
jgi:3'-5' exoribonuclease